MDAINEWLDHQQVSVKKELTVKTFAEVGDVYRIDNLKIAEFFPRFSDRQAPSEDKTVPRVCVTPTLLGCIAGYGQFFYDFFEGTPDGENHTNGARYRGGVIVTRIPYEYLLEPSNRLVSDAKHTGEKWLVGYDKNHKLYQSEVIGKAFIASVNIVRRDRNAPFYVYTLYIEVSDGVTMRLSNTVNLEPGYYKLVLDGIRGWNKTSSANPSKKDHTISTISKGEYVTAKGQGIDLLSRNISPAGSWR